LLRRAKIAEKEDVLSIGPIRIDNTAHQVYVDDEPIDLSYKEYKLLCFFVKNRGIALSREKILDSVWDYDYFGDARTIDTHVKKLRSKLGKEAGNLIKTVWGMGYKMEEDPVND
jgi:DNA-binding response OmpR family regulator